MNLQSITWSINLILSLVMPEKKLEGRAQCTVGYESEKNVLSPLCTHMAWLISHLTRVSLALGPIFCFNHILTK